MSTRFLIMLMACGLTGCLSKKPDSYIGTYALTTINGHTLPFTNEVVGPVVSGVLTVTPDKMVFNNHVPNRPEDNEDIAIHYRYVKSNRVIKLGAS